VVLGLHYVQLKIDLLPLTLHQCAITYVFLHTAIQTSVKFIPVSLTPYSATADNNVNEWRQIP